MKHIITLAVCLLAAGCQTNLEPGGAYTDKVVFRADQTINSSYDILRVYLKWEMNNREALKSVPEITASADYIRSNMRLWFNTATSLVDAYKVAPSVTGKEELDKAISIIQTAVAEAATWMVKIQQQKH